MLTFDAMTSAVQLPATAFVTSPRHQVGGQIKSERHVPTVPATELELNPFERVLQPVLRLVEWFPFWRDDRDAPPDDRSRLR